jgi:hydrogenase/urease accessory protein HupE
MPVTSINLSNIFIIIVIVLILLRVIYRRLKTGLNGQQYKTSRLFRIPVIYFLLLIFFMLAFIRNIDYVIIIMLICAAGIIPGLAFGERVSFFERNGKVFYKRSPYLLAFWTAGFIVRIALEFIYPNNLAILFIVDAILAVTLGLIVGEAIRTYRKYKQYTEENNLTVY